LAAGRGAVGRGVGVAARGGAALGCGASSAGQGTAGVGHGRGGGGSVATLQSTNPRSGVINFSTEDCTSLLQGIEAVLPISNEQWQVVAELHVNQYSHCN
jgi:hypothetical protein